MGAMEKLMWKEEIGFNPKNIIAGELEVENDRIIGSRMIVSDDFKGYVIKELKNKHKVIGVGHGMGDKKMLENSDISISFNSEISGLAQFNVDRAESILEIIEKET